MDIKKYLLNKEVQLTDEDINVDKLAKDIRKGYVPADELDKVKDEVAKEYTGKYSELEEKFNTTEKNYTNLEARNTELTNSNKGLKLQVEMVSQGFDKKDFEEVSKLRNTLYAEEEDDSKAIAQLKEKYQATYFPQKPEEPKPEIPNESGFNQKEEPKQDIEIKRSTSIKDLFIKK